MRSLLTNKTEGLRRQVRRLSSIILVLLLVGNAFALEWREPIPPDAQVLDTRGRFKFVKEGKDNFLTFCNDRLCEISGRIYSRDALDNVLENCIAAYGRPNYIRENLWIWYSHESTDLLITYDEKEQIGYYLYHFSPIFTEMYEDKLKERLKEKKEIKKDVQKDTKKIRRR